MVVLAMPEMCHTMLLWNPAATATDVPGMIVRARNSRSSHNNNLHLRHLRQDILLRQRL